MEETWEFFAPFAHIPGRLEWCRIRSPTHGVFDTCIVLGDSTADAATVYVNDDSGEAFMAERYPECTTIRVHAGDLRMRESPDGRRLHCRLVAHEGPLRRAEVAFLAQGRVPRQTPYGGQGRPVWGSRYTCWGVDLEYDAELHGILRWEDEREVLSGTPGILTVGSCAKITPLAG